jgi:hypothetical protein
MSQSNATARHQRFSEANLVWVDMEMSGVDNE